MKYDYGDTVRIASDAPSELRPNALGEIVGMRSIATSQGDVEGESEEIVLYTVEYGDGESAEIAARWLLDD